MTLILGKESTPEPFSHSLQIVESPTLLWAPPWPPLSLRLLGVAVLVIVDSVPGRPMVSTPAPPASEPSIRVGGQTYEEACQTSLVFDASCSCCNWAEAISLLGPMGTVGQKDD